MNEKNQKSKNHTTSQGVTSSELLGDNTHVNEVFQSIFNNLKIGEKPVVTVDHGNVFGTGHWYTFYCPDCGAQITDKEACCRKCACKLFWEVKTV